MKKERRSSVPAARIAVLRNIQGVLLDLDGTLYQDRQPLPGAAAAVRKLRAAGLRLRFLTNTSRRPRRAVVEDLRRMGFLEDEREVQTAPSAAAEWLRAHGMERVALFVPEATRADFAGFELDGASPQAVVVGDLGEAWDFAGLNRAFRLLLEGATLVALQRNRYWRQGGELLLDAGPFVVALEHAAAVEAVVVGKPSLEFFRTAVVSLELAPEEVAMVGDDVVNDVGAAQAIGCKGVLVRSGKYRAGDEARAGVAPDAVLDSVGGLPAYLR